MRNLQVTFKENRIKRISCVHKNFKRISNVWILVCPHETETSRKKKIILPGYRQVYSLYKNKSYLDIAKDVETRFDTSNFELKRGLAK